MISKPNEEICATLCRLSASKDFQQVIAWLSSELMATAMRLEKEADDNSLRQQQGKAQTLRSLVEYANNAGTMLNKYQHRIP